MSKELKGVETMEDYILNIQNKYDEYLMQTENRSISYGELVYIQNLNEKELKELEEELDKELFLPF